MIRILLVIASVILIAGCSSPAPAPAKATPPKTVTVTQPAPPAPQVILPPEFPDVLKRLAAVEGKLTMLESSQKYYIPQSVTDSLKKQQAQIDALASLKYEVSTIRTDLESVKARLSAIEARLTAVGH